MKYAKLYWFVFVIYCNNMQSTIETDNFFSEQIEPENDTTPPQNISKEEVTQNLKELTHTSFQKSESNIIDALKKPKDIFTNQDADDLHNERIKQSLQNLPAKNRPENIDYAMQLIKQGKQVFNLIKQGLIFDALSLNVDPRYLHHQTKSLDFVSFRMALTQAHDEQLFKLALNSDDETFWKAIKDDPVIKKSITNHKVPFTLESFQLPEYNMFFRTCYIRKNMKNSNSLPEYTRAYQKTIIQLQWHLFAEAITQDQAFTSGMITFVDPDFKVFKSLDGYAELVSPKYKFYTGTDFHSIWADQAYTRESSHWTNQKALDNKNFGIDIKNKDGELMSILPGNKSHILFGIRTNAMTFIKWEEYGTTFNIRAGDYSVLHHTLRYFEKKDLQDDPTLERREKVPGVVEDLFEKLYAQALSKKEKEDIKIYGISEMLKLLEQDNAEKTNIFKKFLIQQMHYQPDTLSVRKGSEIILYPSDIIKS